MKVSDGVDVHRQKSDKDASLSTISVGLHDLVYDGISRIIHHFSEVSPTFRGRPSGEKSSGRESNCIRRNPNRMEVISNLSAVGNSTQIRVDGDGTEAHNSWRKIDHTEARPLKCQFQSVLNCALEWQAILSLGGGVPYYRNLNRVNSSQEFLGNVLCSGRRGQ